MGPYRPLMNLGAYMEAGPRRKGPLGPGFQVEKGKSCLGPCGPESPQIDTLERPKASLGAPMRLRGGAGPPPPPPRSLYGAFSGSTAMGGPR